MRGGKQGVVAGRSGDLYRQGVERSRVVPSCAGGRRQDLQEDSIVQHGSQETSVGLWLLS